MLVGRREMAACVVILSKDTYGETFVEVSSQDLPYEMDL